MAFGSHAGLVSVAVQKGLKNRSIVEMQTEKVDLLSLCGILKPRIRGVKLEDFEEAIAKEATEQ